MASSAQLPPIAGAAAGRRGSNGHKTPLDKGFGASGAGSGRRRMLHARSTGSTGSSPKKTLCASSTLRSSASTRNRTGLRSAAAGNVADAVLDPQSSKNSLRHNVCLELLVAGHVEAFDELFELTETHESGQQLSADERTLRTLQRNLSIAEAASRKGDDAQVIAARRRAAEHLEEGGNDAAAAHFRKSCMDLATRSSDAASKTNAWESLGLLAERRGHLTEAASAFDAMYDVAKADCLEQLAPACKHCARVGLKVSEQLAASGDRVGAIAAAQTASKHASDGSHADLQCKANFQLGCQLELDGQAQDAVTYLEKFIDSDGGAQNEQAHSVACAALARCHESLGDLETAVHFLTRLVSSSTARRVDGLLSSSCAQLGQICSKQGKQQEAGGWFEKALENTESPSRAQAIQVQAGLARAQSAQDTFLRAVLGNTPEDLQKLLQWKASGELPS
eukprot:m.190210 g.190210  ORF g.190210 m.190210 type:complete len:451 (+) comp18223_c2_seq1:2044-3396(+)